MLVPPTRERTTVNTLDLRSHLASLLATSTTMRALPSSASSMRRTRPIGKPENVMFMPTTTPSESSDTSTSFWLLSNKPRAYITYSAAATINVNMKPSSSTALNSRWSGTGGGVASG